jgi:hypothetical protein
MTHAHDRTPVAVFAAAGLCASLALYMLFYRASGTWDYNFGYGYGRDFVNFWAAGRLAASGDVATLFDTARYNAWLATALGDPIKGGMVYSYPPTLIALLMPIGLLPYPMALAVWSLVGAVVLALCVKRLAPEATQAPWVALAAPALAVAIFQGHPTAIFAALFVTALTSAATQPVLAGVLLGLLTVKPQLGVIAGIVMLIERRWTTVATTIATAFVLVALSALLVGIDGWTAYLTRTIPMHRDFLVEFTGGFTYFLTTPYAGFRALGAGHTLALSLHLLLAVGIAAIAVMTWRRAADRMHALLIVALASVLVTPYANIYDLALTLPPLAVLAVRHLGTPAWSHWNTVAWLAPAFALPLALITGPLIGLILAIGVLIRASVASTREPAAPSAHEPARA